MFLFQNELIRLNLVSIMHKITMGVCSMDKTKTRSLLAFLGICYAVSFIAGMITRPEIGTWYATLAKPSWQPPNWLFAPVWTLLYGLMAVAGWKVWCSAPSKLRTCALRIFGVQLAVNFLWSPLFFSFHQLGLGVFVIVCLAVLLFSFILLTWTFVRGAAWLFVPYLLWVCFAMSLNFTVWRMNTH
jgi:translocator protein